MGERKRLMTVIGPALMATGCMAAAAAGAAASTVGNVAETGVKAGGVAVDKTTDVIGGTGNVIFKDDEADAD